VLREALLLCVSEFKVSAAVDRLVARLAPFTTTTADGIVRLCHPTVASWLRDEKSSEAFYADPAEGRQLLLAYFLCLNASHCRVLNAKLLAVVADHLLGLKTKRDRDAFALRSAKLLSQGGSLLSRFDVVTTAFLLLSSSGSDFEEAPLFFSASCGSVSNGSRTVLSWLAELDDVKHLRLLVSCGADARATPTSAKLPTKWGFCFSQRSGSACELCAAWSKTVSQTFPLTPDFSRLPSTAAMRMPSDSLFSIAS
jgi:hypothetical protein